MGKKPKIPAIADQRQGLQNLNSEVAKIHGLDKSSNESPCVNLKYIQTKFQCFSEWKENELKDFSAFINKLSQTTWPQMHQSGGSLGHKTGLGLTHLPRDIYPAFPYLDNISPEINFFELRINDVARVHGFRSHSAFFLVYLDRKHQFCK